MIRREKVVIPGQRPFPALHSAWQFMGRQLARTKTRLAPLLYWVGRRGFLELAVGAVGARQTLPDCQLVVLTNLAPLPSAGTTHSPAS